MASRPARIVSRIAFFLCGAISVLISRVYWAIQGLAHANSRFRGHWSLFSAALLAVGVFAIIMALLPSGWIERVRNDGSGNGRLSSAPIKMLASFALFSYILTVGLEFAPHSWHPDSQSVFLICPACAANDHSGSCIRNGVVVSGLSEGGSLRLTRGRIGIPPSRSSKSYFMKDWRFITGAFQHFAEFSYRSPWL